MGSLILFSDDSSWLTPSSPVVWNVTVLLAACLLLAAEAVRSWSDRLSQSLVGAGVAALLVPGLFFALNRPLSEFGCLVVLAVAVGYAFLRLGMDAGLLVTAAGMAAGGLLGGSELGVPLLACLVFVCLSRSVPSRRQIVGLIGISAACVLAGFAGWASVAVPVLRVVVPWSLHFGSSRPWRWTAIASVLAFLSLVLQDSPQTAEGALALAAGLLLLAVPLARRSVRDADPGAAHAALAPLLAATVVATALGLQRGMEADRPWLGALLAVPLLGWVGWRFRARWFWLPVLAAAFAALGLFARNL